MGPWAGADGFLRGAEIGRTCGHGGCAGALQRDRLSLAACAVCGAVALRHRPARARGRHAALPADRAGGRWRSAYGDRGHMRLFSPARLFHGVVLGRSVEFWRDFCGTHVSASCLALGKNVLETGPGYAVQIVRASMTLASAVPHVGLAITRVSETPPLVLDRADGPVAACAMCTCTTNDGALGLHERARAGIDPDAGLSLPTLDGMQCPGGGFITIENQNCEPIAAHALRAGAISFLEEP